MIPLRWCFLLWAAALQAPVSTLAEVSLSFLQETQAIDRASTILRQAGCPSEALLHWRGLVARYNASGKIPELQGRPPLEQGFQRFPSMETAVSSLPDLLENTEHEFEINCFDTVLVLMGSKLRARGHPDSLAGIYLAPHVSGSGEFRIHPAATPRDAFHLIYSDWYREYTSKLVPGVSEDQRVMLSAALFTSYVLPSNVTEEDLAENVHAVLKLRWRERGLRFPKSMHLVLCHEVNYPERWFVTVHAGLMVRAGNHWAYFEKAGGRGPFVFLEFQNPDELQTWFSGAFRKGRVMGYTHHFTTQQHHSISAIPDWNLTK